jgi:hypothetical protein
MGWESRSNQRATALIATRLVGMRVAVDVQHLYRASHPGDQGSVYTDATGAHVTEAHLATIYALAMADWFRARGATVYTNDTRRGLLVGDYWTRNRQAAEWGCHAYLACHVNAGGGRYAAAEYIAGDSPIMANAILAELARAVPELVTTKVVPLTLGVRGAVCIESFHRPGASAVLVEPFFGDCAQCRPLWAAPRLAGIGAAIGEGVARWWEAQRMAAIAAASGPRA